MPPHTSSSNDRLPVGGWPRTWAAALLLTLVPLTAWDVYWSTHGFRPQVIGADEAWVLSMASVPRATTVVLGTSRIQASLDPAPFREVMGGKPPVSLALWATTALPLLEYLADSTTWSGLLVAELMPFYVFDATQVGAPFVTTMLARYAHDRVSPASMTEAWLRVHLTQYLTFRQPTLLPARLLTTWREGKKPRPWAMHLRPDRFGPVAQLPLKEQMPWNARDGFYRLPHTQLETAGRPADPAEFAALTARIERAAKRLQDRGARVVFVYLRACGNLLELEERRYPREQYWDPFARQTRAVAIASADVPGLTGFACYDGAHIDEHDAPAYSRALAEAIRAALASGRTGPWPPSASR